MYGEYLEYSGYDVIQAANGMEALQRAVDDQPDIILMDLSLPVMDGWEATRRLKANALTAAIPVVALDRSRPRRHFRRRQEGRLRLVRHQAVPARRSVKEIKRILDGPRRLPQPQDPQERKTCENRRLAPAAAAAPGRRQGSGKDGSPKSAPPKPQSGGRSNGPGPRRAPVAGGGGADAQGERAPSEKVVQGGKIAPAADTHKGTSRGKYVYCIIEASDPLRFGPVGIGAEPSEVYSVHYKNLAAVVSDAPLEVLDSTRENVLAHERVNETVMREHTVIPMSFGTIFKTREDIVELLRSAAEAFGDVLNKMQNKLEFGLKVLWDRDQAIREVEAEDEDIGRLKKEISGQKGPTYFARMQYGRLVDAALQARSERYVADILDLLRDVSVASRINKPIGDKMIMNAAFLISRDDEGAFDAKVKTIASKLDKLTFKYTGPWPPYNFVNIRLKLERA
jgi:CheY-like chemotaxis protein